MNSTAKEGIRNLVYGGLIGVSVVACATTAITPQQKWAAELNDAGIEFTKPVGEVYEDAKRFCDRSPFVTDDLKVTMLTAVMREGGLEEPEHKAAVYMDATNRYACPGAK